jgi:AbiJ N-terminal domain 4
MIRSNIMGAKVISMDSFSKRHGYRGPAPEITIREDAPEVVRAYILSSIRRYLDATQARQVICTSLQRLPDRGNWSAGNVWDEVTALLENCEWFRVYDLLEAVYTNLEVHQYRLQSSSHPFGPLEFAEDLNALFEEYGIGWKMENGRILARGTEAFEVIIQQASPALQQVGMQTSSDELHKAIQDLSRRPVPDLTGAVQHGMAALECAAKHIAGITGKSTLDDVAKTRPDLFRPPLNEAIPKLWGFASNRGRHILEGGEPTYKEVELVVGVAATLATYLSRTAAGH